MPDPTRRDALERTICYRLAICDEAELRKVDAYLGELERKRFAIEDGLAELVQAVDRGDAIVRHEPSALDLAITDMLEGLD